jgi:hypothetical protein
LFVRSVRSLSARRAGKSLILVLQLARADERPISFSTWYSIDHDTADAKNEKHDTNTKPELEEGRAY